MTVSSFIRRASSHTGLKRKRWCGRRVEIKEEARSAMQTEERRTKNVYNERFFFEKEQVQRKKKFINSIKRRKGKVCKHFASFFFIIRTQEPKEKQTLIGGKRPNDFYKIQSAKKQTKNRGTTHKILNRKHPTSHENH